MSKLSDVAQLLVLDPNTDSDVVVKKLKVTKTYAYNLLSTVRKKMRMNRLPDGTWKHKIRMQSAEGIRNEIVMQHTPDVVNHPPHYKVGGIETIDFIESKNLDYHLGNVVKYVARAGHKDNKKQDLEKAKWYLERALSKLI